MQEWYEFRGVQRDEVVAPKGLYSPDNSVVLIVDESVRADYLDMNTKGTGTSPWLAEFLEKYPGARNYGIAISATTISLSSGICLMTGVYSFPDVEKRSHRNPTLFDIAKAYGYETTVFTVDSFPNKAISGNDLKNIDHYFLMQDLDKEKMLRDFIAAKKIKEILKKKGQFVVLFKSGVHVPYENSYPFDEKNRLHRPSFEPGDSYNIYSPQKAVNSYKNALSFNIDTFFKKLFVPMDENITFLYTSDHGQSLQEHGKGDLFTHSRNHAEQSFVPFVVVTSDAWVEQYLPTSASLGEKPLGHFSIYPTIVSILTRDRDYKNGSMVSILSDNFSPYSAFFLYGGMRSRTQIFEVTREQIDTLRVQDGTK